MAEPFVYREFHRRIADDIATRDERRVYAEHGAKIAAMEAILRDPAKWKLTGKSFHVDLGAFSDKALTDALAHVLRKKYAPVRITIVAMSDGTSVMIAEMDSVLPEPQCEK